LLEGPTMWVGLRETARMQGTLDLRRVELLDAAALCRLLWPWFRGAGWLDSHATVEVFSNAIGVSMPRLLWRRCRLWQISR